MFTMRHSILRILHNYILSTISNYPITYPVIIMIHEQWNKAYGSLFEVFYLLYLFIFGSCMFSDKNRIAGCFRLGVYNVAIFQNRPIGRKLKFSGLWIFVANLWIPSSDFRHLRLGACFRGYWRICHYAPSPSVSSFQLRVFRLAEGQAS
jgi:hypothetical protein